MARGDGSEKSDRAEYSEWDDWIRDWQMSLRADGKTADTLRTYDIGARLFVGWLAGAQDFAPEDVTRRDVEKWLVHLTEAGMSDSTRRLRLMTLRSFFAFIIAEPNPPLTVNPAIGIKAPVAELPHVDIVPDADLAALLKTCDTSFLGLRDTAVVRTMVATGLRRGELVGLDVDDLDLRHQVLSVLGKGGKPRAVSIGGSKTPLALSRYLRARRRHPRHADPALFLGHHGRISGAAVHEMLRRRSVAAGIPVVHPHALRHLWAHLCKLSGLSDEDLERMGGWSAPGMVRRYGRGLADERARAAHAALGVGDRV